MFEQAFRNIDDALRKEAGCATQLDDADQTCRLIFLKCLDGLEQDRAGGLEKVPAAPSLLRQPMIFLRGLRVSV